MKAPRLVCGVGINDADFPMSKPVNGKIKKIPSYECWKNMLFRCYSPSVLAKSPCYSGCSVCDEWLSFSAFHEWFEGQHKEPGWHLDKDLLTPGNKCYSPDSCIFVPQAVNSFTTDNRAKRGDCLIGVNWHKRDKRYRSQCKNPFTGADEHLGYFTNEQEAHFAWKRRKHELACQLAETAHDPRLAEALRTRYT